MTNIKDKLIGLGVGIALAGTGAATFMGAQAQQTTISLPDSIATGTPVDNVSVTIKTATTTIKHISVAQINYRISADEREITILQQDIANEQSLLSQVQQVVDTATIPQEASSTQ